MARSYSSQLRAEQAQATRLRILEAGARVMARPLDDFSIPAVADEAGVAVATVYRNFNTRQELIDALLVHYSGQIAGAAGIVLGDTPPAPATPEELRSAFRAGYERMASLDPTLQAALATRLADDARRAHRDERVQRISALLQSVAAGMTIDNQNRLVQLAVVLASSATVRSFDVLLGASPGDAADVVTWAIMRLARPDANGRRG